MPPPKGAAPPLGGSAGPVVTPLYICMNTFSSFSGGCPFRLNQNIVSSSSVSHFSPLIADLPPSLPLDLADDIICELPLTYEIIKKMDKTN